MNKNVKIRKILTNVKGKEIEFDEYYLIDPKTGEEKFNRNLEIENDIRLYDLYKKQMNLLTSKEIKDIRNKYGMTQKEYALALGVGEITIHRFENGSIQTEAVDGIMRLSNDPDNMYNLLLKNFNNLPDENYLKLVKKVNELQILKHHSIAKFNINDFCNIDFETLDVFEVANELIIKYNDKIDKLTKKYQINELTNHEYLTPLKLQKLLYYIQGISLKIFGKPAFKNNIYAWSYGPVVKEIYQKYKDTTILTPSITSSNISDGLTKIIEIVIDSYGQIEAEKLINLTHNEEPWKTTKTNEIIDIKKISDYFNNVYNN